MHKGQKRQPPITITRPELVLEVDPLLNPDIVLENLTATSQKALWWRCKSNSAHVWKQRIATRSSSKVGCRFCLLEKENLAVRYPEVAQFWHATKNGDLRPTDVMPGTERKVWWWCPEDVEHDYESSVYSRAVTKTGCSFCGGIKLDTKRSLAVHNPEFAKEWHPFLNGELTPSNVSYGSGLYVWWRCVKDDKHEWQDVVSKRTIKNAECPFCTGYYVTEANSLAGRFPEIAAEWHPTKNRKLWPKVEGDWKPVRNRRVPQLERQKNRKLTPRDVSITSHELAWWKCKINPKHEWQAVVADRVRNLTGCRYCTNQGVSDDNNLAVVHPNLIKLWHPTRNLPLEPKDVVPGSAVKVWWRCSKAHDHVWKAPVSQVVRARKSGGHGCAFCNGKKVCSTNNLAAQYPEVAALWHPEKNDCKPEKFYPGNDKSVWWRCKLGHEYKKRILDVVASFKRGGAAGCSRCSGRQASEENNLEVCFPAIAKLIWDEDMNAPIRASDVTYKTTKMYWWRCPRSKHPSWQEAVRSIVQKHMVGNVCCPLCS